MTAHQLTAQRLGGWLVAITIVLGASSVSASVRVKTGTYTGSGSSQAIVVGYQPDVVIVRGNTYRTLVHTATMPAGASKFLDGSDALAVDTVTSLDSTGFTVGTGDEVSAPGVTYHYIAFRSEPGQMDVGTYTGNGQDNRDIVVGFEPAYVMVLPQENDDPHQRFSTNSTDASFKFESANDESDRIQDFTADGFEIGKDNDVNDGGKEFHYVAWSASSVNVADSFYFGSSSPKTVVTGFLPELVLVRRSSSGSPTTIRPSSVAGDLSFATDPNAPFSNGITQLDPDGFTLGTNVAVNQSFNGYHWVAFRDGVTVDLAVSNQVSDLTPTEGDTLTHQMVLTNLSADTGANVVVVDSTGSGLSYLNHKVTYGTYNPSQAEWSLVKISAGMSDTLAVTYVVDPGTAGSTVDAIGAIISAEHPDDNTANNRTSQTVSVQGVDIQVAVEVSDANPMAQSSVDLLVVATNVGSTTASSLEITDTIPSGLSYASHATTAGSYVPGSGVWTVGSLSPAVAESLTVTVDVDPGREGQSLNASAQLTDSDPVDVLPGNDTDDVDILVQGADLSVRKDVDDSSPNELAPITYTLVVNNDGPSTATGVALSDALDSRLTFVGATESQGVYDDQAGVWTIGTIAPGDSATLDLDATVNLGTTGAVIPNLAVLTTQSPGDPDADDRSDQVDVAVAGVALSLDKVVDNASPNETDTINYTLTVSNLGLNDATGIEVEDPLPAGVTWSGDTPSQGTYAGGVWMVGPVASGSDATLGITATVDAGTSGQTIVNQAWIRAVDQGDADASDDSSAVEISVGGADLRTTVSVDDAFPNELDQVRYTVALHNDGPSSATAEVGFDIPPGTAHQGHAFTVGNYAVGTGKWNNVGPIAPGASDTLWVDVEIDLGTGGTVISGVVIIDTSSAVDPNPANDGSSADLTVQLAEVGIHLSADETTPAELSTVGLTLQVTNSGPDPVAGLAVSQSLPAELAYLGHSAEAGSFNPVSGVWTIAALGSGASVSLDTDVRPVAGSAGADAEVAAAIEAAGQADHIPGDDTDMLVLSITGPTVVSISSVVQIGHGLLPGDEDNDLLEFELTNSTAETQTLQSLTVHDAAPSSKRKSDEHLGTLWLSSGGSPLGSATVAGGFAAFQGLNLTFDPTEKRTLRIRGGASLSAPDGAIVDLKIEGPQDFAFDTGSTVQHNWPVDPPATFVVDGMAAAQLTVHPIVAGPLLTDSQHNLALDLTLPPNGDVPDQFERLNIVNLGSATSGADLGSVTAWSDGDDDGLFDPLLDAQLGELSFTGDRWELTSIGHPVPQSGARVFVSVDVHPLALSGASVQLAIPSLPDVGIGMASDNDGPLDQVVSSGVVQLITAVDRVTLGLSTPPASEVSPGQSNVLLCSISLTNTYSGTQTLTGLTLRNAISGSGSQVQLDQTLEMIALHLDGNSNGGFDDELTDPVLGSGFFIDSEARIIGLGLPIPVGNDPVILVVARVSDHDARDGDQIATSIPDATHLEFSSPVTVAAAWPLTSAPGHTVDGMIAAQIDMRATAPSSLGPGDGPGLGLDFVVPSNGYSADVLAGLQILNQGTATTSDIDEIRVWADDGNGIFDAGGGDDIDLGPLTFVDPVWQSPPLSQAIPYGGKRLYVGVSASTVLTDSSTVQLSLPLMGLTVASDNDGPRDAPIDNPNGFLLSTAPLLASLDIVPGASTLGQSVDVAMVVRNSSGETVTGIQPSALDPVGPGALLPIAGPTPASFDLADASVDTFRWTYQASGTGTVQLSGYAQGVGQPSALQRRSLPLASNIHRVFAESDSLSVFPVPASPFVANRGQTGIVPMSLTFRNERAGADISAVLVTGLRFRVEDVSGTGIAPADLLSQVQVREGTSVYVADTTPEPTGAHVQLQFDQPIRVTNLEPVTVNMMIDIMSSTVVPNFVLSVESPGDLFAIDENSSAPITINIAGATFPVKSGLASVLAEATEIRLSSAATGSVLRANQGQNDVSLITLDLLNPGVDGLTADARVSRLPWQLETMAGVLITDLSQVLQAVQLWRGPQLLVQQPVLPGQSELILDLSPQLTVPVNTSTSVELLATIIPDGTPQSIRLRLGDPLQVLAIDVNTRDPLAVQLDDPPVIGPELRIEIPATTATAVATPSFPPQSNVGQADILAQTIRFAHPGPAGTAGVSVQQLVVRARDGARVPVDISQFLSQMELWWNGSALVTIPAFAPGADRVTLAIPPLSIVPGGFEELELRVDVSSSAPLGTVELSIHQEDVLITDTNSDDPLNVVAATGGEFPLSSGLTGILAPARELRAALQTDIDANVVPGALDLPALAIDLTNTAGEGSGSIQVDQLVLRAADAGRSEIAIGRVLGGAGVYLDGTAMATVDSLGEQDGTALLAWSPPLVVESAASQRLEIRIDLRDAPTVPSFRLGVTDTDVGVVQPASALLEVSVVAPVSSSFPQWTEVANVVAGDLENSFSNFPNPFAAGRDHTTFAFYLASDARVTLTIYDAVGDEATVLADAAQYVAGMHEDLIWDGRNDGGVAVRNGVYLGRLLVEYDSGDRDEELRKVLVIR